jgi:hypothetical protein
MSNKIIFLRISYWLGAVLDGVMIVPMLSPRIGTAMFGLESFNPGTDYRYAMMIGASLMLGWTILLIWADRKPLDRKGVLLITALPVVAGMMLAGVYAVATGFVSWQDMLPTWILQAILLVFFLYSFFVNLEKKEAYN